MVNIQVDESFYEDEFGGNTIPSDVFEKFINDAYLQVMNSIQHNLQDVEENETEIIERIKYCQCEIADFNYIYGPYGIKAKEVESGETATATGEVKSETVGTVSRTYTTSLDTLGTFVQKKVSNPDKYIRDIIRKYLGSTGLLYGGLQ